MASGFLEEFGLKLVPTFTFCPYTLSLGFQFRLMRRLPLFIFVQQVFDNEQQPDYGQSGGAVGG